MNNDDFNKLIQNAQKKTGIDMQQIKQAAQDGNLDDFINKNLSSDASKQLKNILSDKEAAQKLLSTTQAKELMKKLMEGK